MSARLSIIPAGAVTDESLEPRDLQVLCLLGRHTDKQGWCVRSQVKMSAEIHCGRATLQRSLERLVEAGWVQKKQRGIADGAAPSQPSASYAYRVILDRDDYAFEAATRDDPEEGVPTDGHPPRSAEGARPDEHPGAHPRTGTGAHVCTGTNNDPLERPHLERERDARARDRKARFLVDFEARWPSAAHDSRQKTAYAAEALTEDEERAALDGIAAYLDGQKRLGRKAICAGSTYLEERRWTLLARKAETHGGAFAEDSREAKAIAVLHAVAGKSSYFHSVMKRPGAGVFYRGPVEPRLIALADAPPVAEWPALDHRQAGAWEELLRTYVTVQARNRLVEGSRAPWPWPPRKDGSLGDAAGDDATATNEGQER